MNIKELISKLTLEEKASLCSGLNFWETKPLEKHDVPSIMMTDGPHGLRKVIEGDGGSEPATCFPPAVLSACSFDRELLFEVGETIADEAEAKDVRIVLGPGVNIKRSPLCGRNFEYFSEDPLLAGEMAAAFIKGVQSKGIGTSLKHYAANNQETRRWSSDSVIDERTLREIYLPAFKRAVEQAKPATVMCSYNRLNGEYASESKRLLTDILRDEWGFDGIVISDWGAVNDRVLGLKAGLDIEMPGVAKPSNDEKIVKAVKDGTLDEAVLDTVVERILSVICRFGGDEVCCRTYECGRAHRCREIGAPIDIEQHDALARKVAAESMVLLKNDTAGNGKSLLPLDKNSKIVFIGEMAEKPRYQGGGSSHVAPFKLTSALDAAKEYANVTYCKGYNTDNCDEINEQLQNQALDAAKSADVCVLFIGLPPHYESEGYDREHIRIPDGMNKLVSAAAAVNKNIVVVLSNGSPVEMPWVDEVPAILESYLGGQAGGGAVADILFGKVNPCGKLAESLPKKLSDNPSYLYYFGEYDKTEYREGVFVGYRYYDTKEMEVLFPFGHGLSYTDFEYSDLNVATQIVNATKMMIVSLDVVNTGKTAGKEIVQLYTGPASYDDRCIRPSKELRAFTKIELAPGEKKHIEFTLDETAFSYYNTQIGAFHVLDGDYLIMVGKSSKEICLETTVTLPESPVIKHKAHPNMTLRDLYRIKGGKEFIEEFAEKYKAQKVLGTMNVDIDHPDYGYQKSAPECVLRQTRLMGYFDGLTDEEIAKWMDEKLNIL